MRRNLIKAAAITICCTFIINNTVLAVPKDITHDYSITYSLDNIINSKRVEIKFNGQPLQMTGKPFIEKERTLVPALEFVKILEADAKISLQEGTIIIKADVVSIEFKTGEKTAKIIKNNCEKKEESIAHLDVEVKNIDDTVYVPLRFIAETLGAEVKWNSLTRSVMIETDNGGISIEKPVSYDIVHQDEIINSSILSNWQIKNFKTKGIYSVADGGWTYVMVSAGQKPTGGYSLKLDGITEGSKGLLYFHTTLKAPGKDDMVTEVLTYPNIIVKIKKDDIEKLQWDLIEKKTRTEEEDRKEIYNLVQNFGKKIQMVSLLSPLDILKKSMAESYSDFVSPDLLKDWQSKPESAPGRMVSSTCIDHINIFSIKKKTEFEYEVKGELIEITSQDLKNNGVSAVRSIALTLNRDDNSWIIADASIGKYENSSSMIYENAEYGFTFLLPAGWKGYTLAKDKWEGTLINNSGIRRSESGQIINIRHPLWTEENKRQDIPVMIFTAEQWELVKNEKMSVGAAPITPKELGRNNKYIFALPARYNFAFLTGYEEVDKIIEDGKLKPFMISAE